MKSEDDRLPALPDMNWLYRFQDELAAQYMKSRGVPADLSRQLAPALACLLCHSRGRTTLRRRLPAPASGLSRPFLAGVLLLVARLILSAAPGYRHISSLRTKARR